MNSYLIPVYVTYLLATIALCAWLAITLFRNGAVFLDDVFPDRPEMAQAVNRLLVTGFAMANVGYGFFLMTSSGVATSTEAFEVLARKLGVLLVSLAIFHFVNMLVLHRFATARRQRELAPPIAPQRHLPPPPGTPAATATF